MKYKICYQLFLATLIIFISVASRAGAPQSKSVQDWTGKHTKLVWVQDQGDGSDTFARTKKLALYGYDSKDGKGVRLLLKGTRNFFKPLFTPDGKKVIFSDRRDRQMFLLDWDSGKVKKLGSGVAVAVWQDTKKSFLLRNKTIWIYCFDGLQPENKYGTSQPLYRFPLGKPKKKELIWNKTNMAWSNVQLSRDGKLIGGLFPWPHGGIVHSDTEQFQKLGRGCWTSVSPDNSKLLWIFDGLHRNIQVHDVEKNKNWKVNVNNAPGINGFEVYHPRWSNHARYFVMTGPYQKGEGGNKLNGGGEKVEIYIGRFDQKVQSVEDWYKVTNNNRADFYPDLWVEGGEDYDLAKENSGQKAASVIEKWPSSTAELLYVWENMKAANQLPESGPIGFYQCNLSLKGKALFTRNLTLITTGGYGETGDAGTKFGKALVGTGKAAFELLITPAGEQRGAIFTLQGTGDSRLMALQDGASLIIAGITSKDKTEPLVWKDVFTVGETIHLGLNIADAKVQLYKNGKDLGSKAALVDFSPFASSQLSLGDVSGNWTGEISNVALYQEPLSSQQMQQHSSFGLKKLRATKPVKTLVVEGKLSESTEIPAPDSIGAYRRALVVNSYDVDKVIKGEYGKDKIVVAEWAVLDRKIVKEYPENVKAERLTLELFEDHPELEGERQMMDIFEPDLTMYYRLQ